MAIPVARVHLAMEHAALPPLLPAPLKCKMLPLLPTPPCMAAIILPKPHAKPSRADSDSDERWDAHKTKPASTSESSASSSCPPRSASATGRGSSSSKNDATSPPGPAGRADSAERWDAHKKAAASPASSSSKSSSGTSPLKGSPCTISRNRASSSTERWDAHKKRRCPPQAELLDDGERSGTGSNVNSRTEEEIVWKPRAIYAEPGFVSAAPEPSMLPMPTTTFLVRVA